MSHTVCEGLVKVTKAHELLVSVCIGDASWLWLLSKAMLVENLDFYLFGSREGERLKNEKASDISVTVFYSV